MLAVYGDAEAMRWVGDGKPLDRAECRRWIEVTARNYRERGYGMAAVEQLAGDVIGFCGLVHPDGQPDAELKYAYRREYWGSGYATEVAQGMLRYGAEHHGLCRIIATVATEHAVSQRVLAKAGMRRATTHARASESTAVFVWSTNPAD